VFGAGLCTGIDCGWDMDTRAYDSFGCSVWVRSVDFFIVGAWYFS
jgi:hypothetical protein